MSWKLLHRFGLVLVVATLALSFAACAARHYGYYHRVAKGETMYRIAKAYDVEIKQIVRANNMRDASFLREGQFLLIPGRTRRRAIDQRPGVGRRTVSPQIRTAPRVTNLNGRFIWPIKDSRNRQILRPFGKRNQKRNTGIHIAAPLGSEVLSVAAGQVVYAGDGIEGFGNTVIIRHDDEIFSIYSHLQSYLVEPKQDLNQGQLIGRVGRAKHRLFAKQESFLHFEIRERTIPVNPQNLLP